MPKLAEICIRRPVFAAMVILALVVVGTASYFRLGVDRLPSVDLPTVTVRTTLQGAAPEEVESEVSQRLEEAVNTIEGISELRSISGQGSSVLIVTFNLNRNIDVAAQDVRDRVATVIRDLQLAGADPPVISKTDNDDTPILTLALSANRPLRELTEMADKIVKEQLERSSGVGEVRIVGGYSRTINLWIDSRKLAAYQMPITVVRDAVVQQNADVPGGNVTGTSEESNLRTMGRIVDPKKFNDLIITRINGVPIRIRDIGRAEDGIAEARSTARLNGVPTVSLEIRRQSGANTVAVIEAAKQNLQRIAGELPADVKLEIIRDQSNYIYAALHEINLHLVLGSMLACLVVLAFMRSWRSTLIAGIAIPASVISTFGMMWLLHFTLNSVTMLALVLMVGIVIDDAIVVLENIFRFVEEKKMHPMEAARAATGEIALAVLATTLSLVVIFIPVSFMSSVSGRFLYQFGITAAVSVMVSLLVSFTLTPMMSARLLKPGGAGHAKSRGGFYRFIDRSYTWMLERSMHLRPVIAIIALLVIASAVPLYKSVRQEYVPSDVDESEFSVNVTAADSTSLAAMDKIMQTIEQDLKQVRGVQTMLTTVGGGFLGQVNTGGIYVRIAPIETRVFSPERFLKDLLAGHPGESLKDNFSQRDVMVDMRKRLAKYRELRTNVRGFPSFNIGGGNFDIDFVIRGPELDKIADYAEQLRQKSIELGGIVDADTTLKLQKPELRVNIDRERAGDLGVSSQDIGAALRLMVGGDTRASRYRDPVLNEDYDVRLRLSEGDRNDPQTINRLFLPRKNGDIVQLSNLATITPATTAARIDRLDRQRSANLRAGIAPGYAMADRIEALRQAALDLNLPPAYTTAISGRGRELERTFSEFLWAFLLSIIFMYMILASQYESLIHPLTILLSLPLSIPFALLSLYLTGGTLNLYSALGILVLFGVVKKNAILQIDHMNHLRAPPNSLPRYEAIIQANRDRLRPILMTTLALVAGMLPLALGAGPGAEERRAVAIVVIGGQTLSLLLTLLVTPVAYSLFDDIRQLRRVKSHVPMEHAPHPVHVEA
ncbi:MAG TPA: efflux RND transporter permease subunit [Tepidisphaeraceae bacterium]|jgi:HAE1 family hydrophobic/amphiphilic exporter-1